MIKINYNSKKSKKGAKHCFIYRGPKMEEIKKALGRENQDLCLKVFFDQDKLDNWGDNPNGDNPKHNTTIKEATQIQNICWYHGLAPRVYQTLQIEWIGQYIRKNANKTIIGENKICDAQVTDDLGETTGTIEDCQKICGEIDKLGKEYGWVSNSAEYKGADIIGGKFVDFQTFNLIDDYKEKIKDKYIEYGTYGKKYYHNVPELDLNGCPRENENRVKWLGLDKVDFKGKVVIDYGCANGWFCRYMDSRGSLIVRGVDTKNDSMKDPGKAFFLVNNYLGHYNIRFSYRDLNNISEGSGDYDIALFLSMAYHIKDIGFLSDAAELVIVEDNSKNRDAKEKLEKLFSRVEHKGFTEDRNNSHLPIYYCYK